MFRLGLLMAALALAACAPRVPDSNPDRSGVGFGDYDEYRQSQLAPPPAAAPAIETTVIPPAGGTDTTRAPETPGVEGPETMPGVVTSATPTAATQPAPTEDGANIVGFALATNHPRGTKMFGRGLFQTAARARINCSGYASADLAQEAFLEAGGPEKDALNLDPDGDGYACAWDPTPFRAISG